MSIHVEIGLTDERMTCLFTTVRDMAIELNDYAAVLKQIASYDANDIERAYMAFVLGSYMGLSRARAEEEEKKESKRERSIKNAITNDASRSYH